LTDKAFCIVYNIGPVIQDISVKTVVRYSSLMGKVCEAGCLIFAYTYTPRTDPEFAFCRIQFFLAHHV